MNITAEEKANKIKEILDSKKAQRIDIIPLKGKTPIAEYFVIASGTSTTHINSLAGEVEKKMSEISVNFLHQEGENGSSWKLLDYGDVIVHIFSEESRNSYKLEELWK